jgi:predicted house-cleaning noncanonical NTP pyrophosphatase (MazG superfamily)
MTRNGKLVRDRIPETIRGRDDRCEGRVVGDADYAERLYEKLAEELVEYQREGAVEELADLVEVVQVIAEARGISWDALEEIRHTKRAERGSFRHRLLLVEVEG